MMARGEKTKLDGLLISLGVTLPLILLLCVGAWFGGKRWISKLAADARKGWKLTTVMAASTDIPEGASLTAEMFTERPFVERGLTVNAVRPPDVETVLKLRPRHVIKGNSLLRWSDFTSPAPLVSVMFATRDIASGAQLNDGDFEVREVSSEITSASWVRPEEKSDALGMTTIAPFRKGDPIQWTHLPPKAAK